MVQATISTIKAYWFAIRLYLKVHRARIRAYKQTGIYPETRLKIDGETVAYWPYGVKLPVKLEKTNNDR